MKKILLTLSILSLSLVVFSQNSFLNPGFENWTLNTPNNWNSLSISGLNLCDISKSTSANTGKYAIGVASKPLSPLIAGAISSLLGIEIPSGLVIPGLLTNGTINIQNAVGMITGGDLDPTALLNIFSDGLVLNSKPLSVEGFYNWNAPNADKEFFGLMVMVTAKVNDQQTLLAVGTYPSADLSKNSPKSNYTSFSIPLIYIDETISPEKLIFIAFVQSDSTSTVFTKLLLDDLSINSGVGVQSLGLDNNNPKAYPNPSIGNINLDIENAEINIVNIFGQEILGWQSYSKGQEIKIKDSGIYFLRIKKDHKFYTEKLIVK